MWLHEVLVSLDAGAVCPSCSEARLEGTSSLTCPVCGSTFRPTSYRQTMRYPLIPSVDGYDLFSGLFITNTQGEVRTMFAIDVDTGRWEDAWKAYTQLTAWAGPVVHLYSSGSKGYHLVIPFETWSYDKPNAPAVFRKLVEILDIQDVADRSIYKSRAMLRVPGTVNTKTGKRKTLVVNAESDRISPRWAELVRQAEQAPVDEPSSFSQEPWLFLQNFTPPCIDRLWLDGIPFKGARHETFLHLCSFYYRRGDSEEETQTFLEDFAGVHGTNTEMPLSARINAAQRIVHSAFRNTISFSCSRGKNLGVCEERCPLHKT